jgi:alanine racemase
MSPNILAGNESKYYWKFPTMLFDPPYRAWAEIDVQALSHNVRLLLAEYAAHQSRPMVVVKANAYGHDVRIVVPTCRLLGISDFAVATVEEGRIVRELAPDARIYLLTAATWFEAPEIVKWRLIPLVTTAESARALADAAADSGLISEVHLDVDTGIGRAGVQPREVCALFESVSQIRNVRITGIATHFVRADEDEDDARYQHGVFLDVLQQLGSRARGLEIHASNSPAATVLGDAGYHSLVRPGLLTYGIEPRPGMLAGRSFRQVLSLRARVLLCRDLPGGATVSYGRTYRVPPEGGRYATIGIGYGDGVARRLSNVGHVLLHGTRAPICGRVCMDQLVVDVSHIPSVTVGDVATLLGTDGAETLVTGDVAELVGTTPHELTTALLPRIPRVAVNEAWESPGASESDIEHG